MDIARQRELELSARAAVQPRLDEPVLSVGLFRRAAGDLVVIAETPMRLHAFAAGMNSRELLVEHEVAVWDRAGPAG